MFLYKLLSMIAVVVDISVAATITCDSSSTREFLYLVNNTCLPCPDSCTECVQSTYDLDHPCISCQSDLTFHPSTNLSLYFTENGTFFQEVKSYQGLPVLGGSCIVCSGTDRELTQGPNKVRLTLTSSSATQTYQEGRLEVFLSGQWSGVCDDGWDMINTHLACMELGLGVGLDFFPTYNMIHPQLQELPIAMDDVKCSLDQTSILKCQSALPKDINCIANETIGIRCSGPEIRRRCLEQCPVGQYLDLSSKSCFPCDSSCLDCFVTSTYCSACQQEQFATIDGDCYEKCPHGKYGNSYSHTCEVCGPRCIGCLDGPVDNLCLECKREYTFNNYSCTHDCPVTKVLFINGTREEGDYICLHKCPSGHMDQIGICIACTGTCQDCAVQTDNCTKCPEEEYLQVQQENSQTAQKLYKCQVSCNTGYYPDPLGNCQLCRDSHCVQCYQGGVYCQMCKPGYKLQFNRCVRTCSMGLLDSEGVCSAMCPDGFYKDFLQDYCEPCRAPCARCTGVNVCTGCHSGFYLKGHECVQDCGPDMVSLGNPLPTNVRLVGGTNSLHGRVEVLYQGVWGYICGSNWTLDAARVVCRELQLGGVAKAVGDNSLEPGGLAIASHVICRGNETSLWNCNHDIPSTSNECHTEVAGVYCRGPDRSKNQECRLLNTVPCDQNPCYSGVVCTDLDLGKGSITNPGVNNQFVSHCDHCPPGMTGNGRNCTEDVEAEEPHIEYPLREVTVLEGLPEGLQITLPCVTQHPQTLAYTWYWEGKYLQDSPQTKVEEEGSLTLVNPVGEASSGLYTCIVSSGQHNDSVSYQLTVQESIQITSPPNSYTGEPPVTLTCGYTGFPTSSVTWYRDGELIGHDINPSFMSVNEAGSLLISHTNGLDSGLYTCELNNGFTAASASAQVTLQGPAHILEKTDEVIALLGHNLTLPCVVAGSPEPKVFWKRALDELHQYERTEATNHILYIYEVEYRDSDDYQCVAANSLGAPDVWNTHILVMEFPEASVSPLIQVVSIGDNVTVFCRSSGNPTPQISWYLPSRGLVYPSNNSAPHQVEWTGDSVTLLDIKESDSGPIQCRATSRAGTATTSATISVKIPPRFMVAPRTERFLAGYPALVGWTVEGVPEPVVTWTQGGDQLSTGEDFNITTEGLLFTPQYPASRGPFSVKATNSEGSLDGTAQLEILPVYPAPVVDEKTPTNMSLNFGGVRQVKGQLYQIVVVRLGVNGTQQRHLQQSPLDVTTVVVNDTLEYEEGEEVGYLTAVYQDFLPPQILVGNDLSYWDNITKTMVHNVPLAPEEWYAVFVKVMTSDLDNSTAFLPVSATHYLIVFSEYSVPDEPYRLAGWAVGLLATFMAMLVVAGAGAVLLFMYWRREGRCPFDPVRGIQRIRKSLLHKFEGPLDVEAVLGQFSPHPSPTRNHNRGLLDTSASSSGSTLYIPTEDEIDKLEEIGIDYYDDDDWLARVPDGVLDVTKQHLEQLKKHAEEEEKKLQKLKKEKESLTRTSSYPSLSINSGSDRSHSRASRTNSVPSEAHATGSLTILEAAAIIKPPESRLLYYLPDGVVANSQTDSSKLDKDTSTDDTAMTNAFVNEAFVGTTDEDAVIQGENEQDSQAHPPVSQRMSSMSKRSDSGFESDRFQSTLSKPKTHRDHDYATLPREGSKHAHPSVRSILSVTPSRGRHHSDTDFETLALLGRSPPLRRSFMEPSLLFRMTGDYREVKGNSRLQRSHSSVFSEKTKSSPTSIGPAFGSNMLSRKLPDIPPEDTHETSFSVPSKKDKGGKSGVKLKRAKYSTSYNPNYIDYLLSEHAKESGAEDSGLESDQVLLRKKSPKWEHSREPSMKKESTSEEDGNETVSQQVRRELSTQDSSDKPSPVVVRRPNFQRSISEPPVSPSHTAMKKQKPKERKRRKRGQRLSHLKAKGAEFFSRGKRWARNMLEWHEKPGEHIERAETSSTSSNTEEDDLHDELSRGSKHPGPPSVRQRQHSAPESPRPRLASIASMADLESSYIDPSTIVSVPKTTTRMQELQEHDPVWAAKLKVTQNVMQAKHAFVRRYEQAKQRKLSLDTQAVSSPPGKGENIVATVNPNTILETKNAENKDVGAYENLPEDKGKINNDEINNTDKDNTEPLSLDGDYAAQSMKYHETNQGNTDKADYENNLFAIVSDILNDIVNTICKTEEEEIRENISLAEPTNPAPSSLRQDSVDDYEKLLIDVSKKPPTAILPSETKPPIYDTVYDNVSHNSTLPPGDLKDSANESSDDQSHDCKDPDEEASGMLDPTYLTLLEFWEEEERHCPVCNEEHRPIWEALSKEEQEEILKDIPPVLPPRPSDTASATPGEEFLQEISLQEQESSKDQLAEQVEENALKEQIVNRVEPLESLIDDRPVSEEKSTDISELKLENSNDGNGSTLIMGGKNTSENHRLNDSSFTQENNRILSSENSLPGIKNDLSDNNHIQTSHHKNNNPGDHEDSTEVSAHEHDPSRDQPVNISYTVIPKTRAVTRPQKLVIPDAFLNV